MNIMAIGAHPDDVAIGCGGTLYTLKKKHDAVLHNYLVTNGEASSEHESRLEEQRDSDKELGIDHSWHLSFTDTDIDLVGLIDRLEKVIKDVEPDYIFTHYPEDTHQDHRIVSKATLSACRNRSNLLYYETISTLNFQPSLIVGIDKAMSFKLDAVASHVSQNISLGLSTYCRALAQIRAYRTGFSFVEAFVPHKFIWG